jgi:hypothetical protein
LAWASIAVAACISTCDLDKFDDSTAKFASWSKDLEFEVCSDTFIKLLIVWLNRFSIAPSSARIDETFSIAPSITLIAELAPFCVLRLIALVASKDATVAAAK